MTWNPIKENNAIDRVRIFFHFLTPLNISELDEFTKPTVDQFQNFGFKQIIRAEGKPNLNPDLEMGIVRSEPIGWVINRDSSQNLIEEVGLRTGAFGYMSTEYDRWQKLEDRFWSIFEAPLEQAIKTRPIDDIRLEYWDTFIYDGNPSDAAMHELFASWDTLVPKNVDSNTVYWQSHMGWSDEIGNFPAFIQRNIDVGIEPIPPKGEFQRSVKIYTMIDFQALLENKPVVDIKGHLNKMHERTVSIFGDLLTEPMKKRVKIDQNGD